MKQGDTPWSIGPDAPRAILPITWRWWNAVILALGVLLGFLSFTDYSLVGSWPDVIFPVIVGLAAFIALTVALPRTEGRGRVLTAAAHLTRLRPSLATPSRPKRRARGPFQPIRLPFVGLGWLLLHAARLLPQDPLDLGLTPVKERVVTA